MAPYMYPGDDSGSMCNELGVMKTVHFWRSRSSTSNENYTYKTLIIRVSKRNGVLENAEKCLLMLKLLKTLRILHFICDIE